MLAVKEKSCRRRKKNSLAAEFGQMLEVGFWEKLGADRHCMRPD
jgi:hypothetical protein